MKKKILIYLLVFILIISISIGYAVLTSSLNLLGSFSFVQNRFSVYLDELKILDSTIENANYSIADDMSISLSGSFKKPGDYIDFSVYIINHGTLDATMESFEFTGIDSAFSNYFECTLKYADGTSVNVGDYLQAGAARKFIIHLEYSYDIEDFIAIDNLNIGFNLSYIQARPSDVSSWNYEYIDREQIFYVPKTGIYKLESWGAQGGTLDFSGNSITGGYGGYSIGNITLNKGEKLYIHIGGKGEDYNSSLLSTTYSSTSYEHNMKVLAELKKLENLAIQYKTEYGSNLSISKLCFDYLRKGPYDQRYWNDILGYIDYSFVNYVDSTDTVDIGEDEYFIDFSTNEKINIRHLMVVLNNYYDNGNSFEIDSVSFSSDYANWVMDLMQVLSSIPYYRIENNITDRQVLLEYVETLIGTNADTYFGTSDMYSDLDALNIYRSSDLDLENLSTTLEKYYVSLSSKYNASNRLVSAREYFGDDDNSIKSNALELLKNTTMQNLILEGDYLSEVAIDLDYEVVAQAFTNYILNESEYLVTTGGGATYIAKNSGLLNSLKNDISSLLIVSGGGSGNYLYSVNYKTIHSGSGGGYIGGSSDAYYPNSDVILKYEGGNQAINEGTCNFGSNSGYGGFGLCGGLNAGGSGYIGNSLLNTKAMYCFSCEESEEYETKTISVENVSEIPTSQYAKIGDGYVKITYMGN